MRRRIDKLAIANRGEVAVRIIRACQDMGIATVLLHSEADVGTLAYRLADERVLIGGPSTADSYLHIERNIQGALSCGADAIHPGFGFLSENADFAEACAKNRIVFLGPSPESIRLFGDKISAKRLVEKIGGPTIPGYQGDEQSEATLLREIQRMGLPVIVKASGGGGGRGLRVVRDMREAPAVIEAARREAMGAFGSDKVFLEKYLDHAKHIEVQIFGDASGKVYHLGERECSIQRRHQKIIEEAPSAQLDDTVRKKILKCAVEIAETAKYRGAGTVEFLYQDGQFYFMEMNTRLQVEHPVTEMVYGMDLVKAQIQTAMEQSLLWEQADLQPRGHAIECRIYAEDPQKGGIPSTGMILGIHLPQGPGRRFEIGVEAGDEVTQYYDSMIAKIIVADESRYRAIRKMVETLKETVFFGVKTNIPMLIAMLEHPEFVDGKMTTRFVDSFFSGAIQTKKDMDRVLAVAKAIADGANAVSSTAKDPGSIQQHPSPWVQRGKS